jgi:hypothetical protein
MGTFRLYDSIREIEERVALFQHLTPSQLEKMLKRVGIADRRPVKESALACRDLVTSFSTMLSFFRSLSTMEPVLSELRMAELRYAALLVLVYLVRADDLATKTGNGDYRAITSTLLLNMAIRDLLSEDEIFGEWYIAHASREQGEKFPAQTCEVCAFLTDCLPTTLAQAVHELEKGMSSSLKECREYASWNLDVLDHEMQELTLNPLAAEPLLEHWANLVDSGRMQYKTIPDVAMKRADLMHRMEFDDMLNKKMKQILDSPVFTVLLPQGGAITIIKRPV